VPAKKANTGAGPSNPPYKQWGYEAKSFPKKKLKPPGSHAEVGTAKKKQVTGQDEKKYGTGAKGDEKEMKLASKELGYKASLSNKYGKMHSDEKASATKKENKRGKGRKIAKYAGQERKEKKSQKKAGAPKPKKGPDAHERTKKSKLQKSRHAKAAGDALNSGKINQNSEGDLRESGTGAEIGESLRAPPAKKANKGVALTTCKRARQDAEAKCNLAARGKGHLDRLPRYARKIMRRSKGVLTAKCKTARAYVKKTCDGHQKKVVKALKKSAAKKVAKKLKKLNRRTAQQMKVLQQEEAAVTGKKAKDQIQKKILHVKARAAKAIGRMATRVKRQAARRIARTVVGTQNGKPTDSSKNRIKQKLQKLKKTEKKKAKLLLLEKQAAVSKNSKRKVQRKIKKQLNRGQRALKRESHRVARRQIRKKARKLQKAEKQAEREITILAKLTKDPKVRAKFDKSKKQGKVMLKQKMHKMNTKIKQEAKWENKQMHKAVKKSAGSTKRVYLKKGSQLHSEHAASTGAYFHKTGPVPNAAKKAMTAELAKEAHKTVDKAGGPLNKSSKKGLAMAAVRAVVEKAAELRHKKTVARAIHAKQAANDAAKKKTVASKTAKKTAKKAAKVAKTSSVAAKKVGNEVMTSKATAAKKAKAAASKAHLSAHKSHTHKAGS